MTRKIQFANNAASTLASSITNTATSLNVAPGDGSKFPSLTGSQYFMATLVKSDGTTEVIKVTARSTDTLTFTRAAEPINGVSTAYAFSAGDRIELRMTAGSLANELDRLDAAAYTNVSNKAANYTVTEADISSLIRVSTSGGDVTVTLPQISSLTDDFDVIVAKVTSDSNTVTLARSGTDTINGQTSYQLASQWTSAWAIADRSTGTWSIIASGAGSQIKVDALSGNGTAGPYTLSSDPGVKSNTAVYVGGAYQQKGTYTLSGTSITLGGVVSVGVPIEVVWTTPQVIQIGTPTDGSVTSQKIADGALAAKIAAEGGLVLPGDAVSNLQAVTKQQLDAKTAGRLIGVQVFNAGSTVYTPTTGMSFVIAEIQAAGGGGGFSISGPGLASGGSGGGGGGYMKVRMTAAQVSSLLSGGSVPLTVGVGGTGGTSAGVAATDGGSSRFGAAGPGCTGGIKGAGTSTGSSQGAIWGGAGGTAAYSYGTILESCAGGRGKMSWWSTGSPELCFAGGGGSAVKAYAGVDGVLSPGGGSTRGDAGSGYGFGGAGSVNYGSASGGLNGGNGVIIVWEYS